MGSREGTTSIHHTGHIADYRISLSHIDLIFEHLFLKSACLLMWDNLWHSETLKTRFIFLPGLEVGIIGFYRRWMDGWMECPSFYHLRDICVQQLLSQWSVRTTAFVFQLLSRCVLWWKSVWWCLLAFPPNVPFAAFTSASAHWWSQRLPFLLIVSHVFIYTATNKTQHPPQHSLNDSLFSMPYILIFTV